MAKRHISWDKVESIYGRSYICGYCGADIASEKGYTGHDTAANKHVWIYICHQCSRPSFFDLNGLQTPGSAFGKEVADIPDTALVQLYSEARRTTASNSFTAAVLCCRKLLMHIAVSKGAKAGDSFASYVQYLADNNYVPPDAKDWIDHIRKKSNEANHEISIMGREDAEELLSFIEMLLKIIYEFPAAIKRKYPAKTP